MGTANSQTHRVSPEIFCGWNALFFADTAHATVIKQDGHATAISISVVYELTTTN